MLRECPENCKNTWHKIIKFQRPRFPLTSLQESKVGSEKKIQNWEKEQREKWRYGFGASAVGCGSPSSAFLLSFAVLPPCSPLVVLLERNNAPSCSLQPYIRSIWNRYISPFHLKSFASPVSKQQLPSLTMEAWHAFMYTEKALWNVEICHLSYWLFQKGWKMD